MCHSSTTMLQFSTMLLLVYSINFSGTQLFFSFLFLSVLLASDFELQLSWAVKTLLLYLCLLDKGSNTWTSYRFMFLLPLRKFPNSLSVEEILSLNEDLSSRTRRLTIWKLCIKTGCRVGRGAKTCLSSLVYPRIKLIELSDVQAENSEALTQS